MNADFILGEFYSIKNCIVFNAAFLMEDCIEGKINVCNNLKIKN